MNDGIDIGTMQAVYERLTRLEERGVARDDRMGRMEEALERLAKRVEVIGADVRDAKTGLRVALWISNTIWPLLAAGGGWVAAHFWHWK